MKTKSIFLAVSALCLLASSCSKSSDSNEDLNSLPFASESVNAGKTNLSTAGDSLIKSVTTIKNSAAVTSLSSLSYLLDQSSIPQSAILSSFKAAGAMSQNDTGYIAVFKSLSATSSKTLSSLKTEFNNVKGTYTWNVSTKKWVKTTTTTDSIKFLFPSSKTGTTNDAKLVISFASLTTSTPLTNYQYSDVPANFSAVLTKGSSKLAEYSFTATYNSGNPSSVVTYLSLGAYKFEINYAYSTSNPSIKYSLLRNSTSLVSFYAAANGNFDVNNISSNNTDEGAVNIVSNGNAYFQVYNIKLAGQIDFKSLYDANLNIENTVIEDSTATRLEVEAANKYASLVLVYADSNKKIAQAKEYYSVYKCNYYSYNSYYTDTYLKFIFADGSASTAESYFGTGFTKLQSDATTFFNSLKTL